MHELLQSTMGGSIRIETKLASDLWSALATKLMNTRSVPEAMSAYQECVAQRMQMAAEDGQRLLEDSQKLMQQMTRSLGNGWPSRST